MEAFHPCIKPSVSDVNCCGQWDTCVNASAQPPAVFPNMTPRCSDEITTTCIPCTSQSALSYARAIPQNSNHMDTVQSPCSVACSANVTTATSKNKLVDHCYMCSIELADVDEPCIPSRAQSPHVHATFQQRSRNHGGIAQFPAGLFTDVVDAYKPQQHKFESRELPEPPQLPEVKEGLEQNDKRSGFQGHHMQKSPLPKVWPPYKGAMHGSSTGVASAPPKHAAATFDAVRLLQGSVLLQAMRSFEDKVNIKLKETVKNFAEKRSCCGCFSLVLIGI